MKTQSRNNQKLDEVITPSPVLLTGNKPTLSQSHEDKDDPKDDDKDDVEIEKVDPDDKSDYEKDDDFSELEPSVDPDKE